MKYCVQQPAAVGYDNVKKLLELKNGNPYSIMSIQKGDESITPVEEWLWR